MHGPSKNKLHVMSEDVRAWFSFETPIENRILAHEEVTVFPGTLVERVDDKEAHEDPEQRSL